MSIQAGQPILASDMNIISPVGLIVSYAGRTAPSGYLLCDGSAISRATYPQLFAAICPSTTFTVTIASPAVFTKTAHGLVAGDKVHFTTTGALPTGLSLNTTYYVLSTGLTANDFRVALSPEGTVINTSGSQSGTHTFYISSYGKGDGSTTFNLPSAGSLGFIGKSAAANTMTLDFESGAVNTGADTIAVPSFSPFPHQGQKIRLTTTNTLPTGLAIATDYYVIRLSSTSIQLASSQANANAATAVPINITGAGTGVHTIIYTLTARTVLGQTFGEEDHSLSVAEEAAHAHTFPAENSSGVSGSGIFHESNASSPNNRSSSSVGGNGLHNNMSPNMAVNYIIRAVYYS